MVLFFLTRRDTQLFRCYNTPVPLYNIITLCRGNKAIYKLEVRYCTHSEKENEFSFVIAGCTSKFTLNVDQTDTQY